MALDGTTDPIEIVTKLSPRFGLSPDLAAKLAGIGPVTDALVAA